MKRYLQNSLSQYWSKKIILITGPRQVGKTTLARSLGPSIAYYNYDDKDNLRVFRDNEWDRSTKVVIFDELHKKKNWKNWLKGIFDSQGVQKQHIVVTGSARLDIAKKMGDSLAGRFFYYHLHPFDLKELKGSGKLESNYKRLCMFSGFPEPFLENSSQFYGLWRRSHQDLILRQDLLNLELIKDISALELMIDMLATSVGSTVSYKSLSEAIEKNEKTVKTWLRHAENLYLIFPVHPYSKNLSRGIKKAAKYYFYDVARVRKEDEVQTEAAKLENLVALALAKEIDFLNDTRGTNLELRFVRTREKKEIDFLILRDHKPVFLFEVKLTNDQVSQSFRTLGPYFTGAKKIQLVKNIKREYSTPDGVQVVSALPYLENLDLS